MAKKATNLLHCTQQRVSLQHKAYARSCQLHIDVCAYGHSPK